MTIIEFCNDPRLTPARRAYRRLLYAGVLRDHPDAVMTPTGPALLAVVNRERGQAADRRQPPAPACHNAASTHSTDRAHGTDRSQPAEDQELSQRVGL